MNWPYFMCLTDDRIDFSHTDQVRALCSAGVSWIQLRCKEMPDVELEPIAFECLIRCREVGATFVLNDRLDLALKIGADGVHLGKNDTPWEEARQATGPDFLIGGTVNSVQDAESAARSDALDYVGIGPFKLTRTKKKPAPVLRDSDWSGILKVLGRIPRYAIGGIEPGDLKKVRSFGVNGVAVCSALYSEGGVSENYHKLLKAYEN